MLLGMMNKLVRHNLIKILILTPSAGVILQVSVIKHFIFQLLPKKLFQLISICSDIVVQIVDARNPLLFRCEDLETYTKEVSEDKLNLLLINKADHLTEEQR